MAQFLIEIAGFSGEITSLFESTRDYCRKYLAQGQADFSVTITREDLAFEQEALRQEALEEGIKEEVIRLRDDVKSRVKKIWEKLLVTDRIFLFGSSRRRRSIMPSSVPIRKVLASVRFT